MADGVTSAGRAPPANQTTNASQSQAQSQAKTDAQAALFGEALEQCPEGLHRPRPNDAPCTYLRPPSLSSQSQSQSQSSKPDLQLHRDVHNPMRGPTDDLNIDYKKKMPHDRDPNPTHGLNPPSVPGDPSYNDGPNHDGHFIMFPLGPQAPKPSPEQEQNQTPYQPPR
jgi:hypothetical protein